MNVWKNDEFVELYYMEWVCSECGKTGLFWVPWPSESDSNTKVVQFEDGRPYCKPCVDKLLIVKEQERKLEQLKTYGICNICNSGFRFGEAIRSKNGTNIHVRCDTN